MIAMKSPNFLHLQKYDDFVPSTKSASNFKELDSKYPKKKFSKPISPTKLEIHNFSVTQLNPARDSWIFSGNVVDLG